MLLKGIMLGKIGTFSDFVEKNRVIWAEVDGRGRPHPPS